MIHGGPSGLRVRWAPTGTIYVDRGEHRAATRTTILKEPLGEKDAKRVYPSTNHRGNWLECIRSAQGADLPGGGRPPLGDGLPPGEHRLPAAAGR